MSRTLVSRQVWHLTLRHRAAASSSSSSSSSGSQWSGGTLWSSHTPISVTPFPGGTTRWFGRKAAKMGQHLDSLREQAHRVSHEEAKEKRKKKKGRGSNDVDESLNDDVSESKNDAVVEEDDNSDDEDTNDDEDDGPSLPKPAEIKKKLMKVVDRLKSSFKSIRGAEPTPEMFDPILVNAYGEKAALGTVAQVVIVSPTMASVTCFDPSLAADVRDAIRDSMELNPQLEPDGLVKVPLPRASMESRQKIVKQLGRSGESARSRLRNIRRKAMDALKSAKDGKMEGVSKDDAFRVAKEIDAIVEDATKAVNDVVQEKEKSVMSV